MNISPACICSRSPRGFAWNDVTLPAWERPPAKPACSMNCLTIIAKRKGKMPGPETLDRIELEAVEAASQVAGEYLEQIGKTDLATMTANEWHGFLGHAFKTIAGEVQRLYEEREVPF